MDTYCYLDDDGHLPDQFRLNESAMLIHNNAKHQVWDIYTPWIHHISVPDSTWDDGYKSDELPLCLVQGYCPQVNCIERQVDRSPAGHGTSPCFGDCYRNCKDRPPTGPLQGRYNRPDQCRQPFKHGVQCAACKRLDHKAANCDMLAIALFIDRYTKKEMS